MVERGARARPWHLRGTRAARRALGRPHKRRRAVRDPAAGHLTQATREAWLREARELVHGTCVALGRRGALLRGGPGSGKSDLALRFMALPGEGEFQPRLVADDQVWVEAGGSGALLASPPETIP